MLNFSAEIEMPVVNNSKSLGPLPEWCVVGESIQIRPYNYSGVIAFIGHTEFANGTWVGVELDVPMGKFYQYILFVYHI